MFVYVGVTPQVKQLLEKVKCMRAIDSTVPELSWEGAVKVLSSNDMEVDTAFYVLQCDWLKPLHDYIFDENNKNVLVNQKEMEEIKKVITNKDVSIEVCPCYCETTPTTPPPYSPISVCSWQSASFPQRRQPTLSCSY